MRYLLSLALLVGCAGEGDEPDVVVEPLICDVKVPVSAGPASVIGRKVITEITRQTDGMKMQATNDTYVTVGDLWYCSRGCSKWTQTSLITGPANGECQMSVTVVYTSIPISSQGPATDYMLALDVIWPATN